MLLWSTVATGFKLGLAVMSVAQLLWLGTLISWTVFALYAAVRGEFRPNKTLLWQSGLLGLINPVLYYLVLFAAYDRLPAHIAQPLNYTWAITLTILAIPMLGQQLNLRMAAGIVISYLGVVVLLNSSGADSQTPLSYTGITLALGSTVLWAAYWLLNTRWQHPPGAVMFYSFTTGLLVLTVIVLSTDTLPTFNLQNLIYGAWVGAIEMGVTFILWQSALRLTTHVGRISQLIFLSPFVSLFIISQVLQEDIGPMAIMGLLIIVAGIVLNQQKSEKLVA